MPEPIVTSKPTQKEWSCVPHISTALVSAKCLAVTAATNDESRPPDNRTPNGTSVISLLMTACTHTGKSAFQITEVEFI